MSVREQQHDPDADALCLDEVSFRYPAQRGGSGDGDLAGAPCGDGGWALRGVTLHVAQGVSLGVIGPNGGGKTTLIKLMLGLLEPTRGTVGVLGRTPRAATRHGGLIGYVPQRHGVSWRFPLTAAQVVRQGLIGRAGMLRRIGREGRAHADHLIDTVGIAPFADRPIGDLSGGQQQRVFIARALAAKPQILLLDEPMVGIDQGGQQRFAQLLGTLRQQMRLTLIVVSHDLRAIAASCDRVACLNHTIHYHDAPQGLTPEVLSEVFEHEVGVV